MSKVMRYRDRMLPKMPYLKFLYWVGLNLSKQNEKHKMRNITLLLSHWFHESERIEVCLKLKFMLLVMRSSFKS